MIWFNENCSHSKELLYSGCDSHIKTQVNQWSAIDELIEGYDQMTIH